MIYNKNKINDINKIENNSKVIIISYDRWWYNNRKW